MMTTFQSKFRKMQWNIFLLCLTPVVYSEAKVNSITNVQSIFVNPYNANAKWVCSAFIYLLLISSASPMRSP